MGHKGRRTAPSNPRVSRGEGPGCRLGSVEDCPAPGGPCRLHPGLGWYDCAYMDDHREWLRRGDPANDADPSTLEIGPGLNLVLSRDDVDRSAAVGLLRAAFPSALVTCGRFADLHHAEIGRLVEKLTRPGVPALVACEHSTVLMDHFDPARGKLLLARDGAVRNASLGEWRCFLNAYDAGIQQVSEILLTQGLW